MATYRTNAERVDIYQRVTSRIIADLEQGVRPWFRPWSNQLPGNDSGIVKPLRHNGEPYRGINVLMLWGEAMASGFTNPVWMTYQQAAEYGGHVRKGERGSLVVYASKFIKTETLDSGEEKERAVPFLKGYSVFNVAQCDDLPERFYKGTSEALPEPKFKRIEAAETFVKNTAADIRHGGNQAFHHFDPSFIQMPPFVSFKDAESYYSTLLHELTHWTRVPHRLDRNFGQKRWGDHGYAAEELVAEIGSSFLCADLGLSLEPRPDHASYIESWLTVLKSDKRAIFTAAGHAQAAADYLHGLQATTAAPEAEAEPETEPTPFVVSLPVPVPVVSPAPVIAESKPIRRRGRVKGKSLYPAPVVVASFRAGETLRMSFRQPVGRAWRFADVENMARSVIGNERARAGWTPDSLNRVPPSGEPAGDLLSLHIEHDGKTYLPESPAIAIAA